MMVSRKYWVLLALVFIALSGFFVWGQVLCPAGSQCSQRVVTVEPRIYGHIEGARLTPTQVFFDEINQVEIISDFNNSRFVYRALAGSRDDFKHTSDNTKEWRTVSAGPVRKPHAITYHPGVNKFFAVDTGNDRLISFDSLDASDPDITEYTEIGVYPVGKRPHDIIYNPVDNYIYVMLDHGVARFMPTEEGISDAAAYSRTDIQTFIKQNSPQANFVIGYMRSFSVVNGALYSVNSTQGNVIQMDNFMDPRTWRVHVNAKQPRKYSEIGSFDQNGLILNDVDFYEGYWYATNYYGGAQHNYLSEASVAKNKLIRWRTWDDFEQSNWEDLSSLVHPESIPYYFSKHENKLYLSMFHIGNAAGEGSGIYHIKTAAF